MLSIIVVIESTFSRLIREYMGVEIYSPCISLTLYPSLVITLVTAFKPFCMFHRAIVNTDAARMSVNASINVFAAREPVWKNVYSIRTAQHVFLYNLRHTSIFVS